jgi:hypothetical protein
MNTLQEIKDLVNTFEVHSEPFRAPTQDERWTGSVRIIKDAWERPVAVVGEFGTHWGDRVVVCEVVDVWATMCPDVSRHLAKVRLRLSIEIMFFWDELSSHKNSSRRGPFEVLIGKEGDGI